MTMAGAASACSGRRLVRGPGAAAAGPHPDVGLVVLARRSPRPAPATPLGPHPTAPPSSPGSRASSCRCTRRRRPSRRARPARPARRRWPSGGRRRRATAGPGGRAAAPAGSPARPAVSVTSAPSAASSVASAASRSVSCPRMWATPADPRRAGGQRGDRGDGRGQLAGVVQVDVHPGQLGRPGDGHPVRPGLDRAAGLGPARTGSRRRAGWSRPASRPPSPRRR